MLLGVDRDASEEEINSARNFLLQQYAGYEESEEAIGGAYDSDPMSRCYLYFSSLSSYSSIDQYCIVGRASQFLQADAATSRVLGHAIVPIYA